MPNLRVAWMVVLVALSGSVSAVEPDTYSAGWGPAVGERVPAIAARDTTGAPVDFAALTGRAGLLLLFNRSADW